MIAQDIPPYCIAQGDRAQVVGLNLVGLKRQGFSAELLRSIKQAYKLVFRSNLKLEEAIRTIETSLAAKPELQVFIDFLKNSVRGLAR